jgi:hypothetical protein
MFGLILEYSCFLLTIYYLVMPDLSICLSEIFLNYFHLFSFVQVLDKAAISKLLYHPFVFSNCFNYYCFI